MQEYVVPFLIFVCLIETCILLVVSINNKQSEVDRVIMENIINTKVRYPFRPKEYARSWYAFHLEYIHKVKKIAQERRFKQSVPEQIFVQICKSYGINIKQEIPVFVNVNGKCYGYIIDCLDVDNGFAFEIDGSYHKDRQKEDEVRQQRIESLGYKVFRISNKDASNRAYEILKQIYK